MALYPRNNYKTHILNKSSKVIVGALLTLLCFPYFMFLQHPPVASKRRPSAAFASSAPPQASRQLCASWARRH
eukprot:893900-Heterocapsa_arctica.AAC.1